MVATPPAPPGAVVISVRGLRKSYGRFEAVRGIDLEVRRGEVFAFLGPNGAGKTTTVEILEGYLRRSGGEVSVLGVDPEHASSDWRARVGVVLQDSTVEPDLTVRECLTLYAGYYASPRPVDELIAAAFGAHVPGHTIPAIVVTIAVGATSFVALGYALTSAIASADSAQPIVQLVMLPLYFISGIFVPSDRIPHWLLKVADVFPVRHLSQALLSAFNPHTTGAGFAWGHIALLAAWGAAGLLVALRRFSWQPRQR